MNLLWEAMNGLGAVLLQVVTALLFEELTFGGLVRLLVAPWPGPGGAEPPTMRRGDSVHRWGADAGSTTTEWEK